MRAWQGRPRPLEASHLITLQNHKRGEVTNYNRSPSLASLIGQPLENADLRAIEVDGEPLVSALPRAKEKRVGYRRRSKLAVQGGFSFAPKQISRRATDDMVIATLASLPLTGDERSPLRSDLHYLALLACALTGPTLFDERQGSVLLTGAVTPGGIKRWWEATAVGRGIVVVVDPQTGEWKELMQANSPDNRITIIGPASWWRGKGYMNHWRLSGGLWRSAQLY